MRLGLVEFPADDPERALRFWSELLGAPLEPRSGEEGEGWQTRDGDTVVGVHGRGPGPGDTWSLPYFTVSDMDATVARVEQLGGAIVHPGDTVSICKDSEGTPFALALSDG